MPSMVNAVLGNRCRLYALTLQLHYYSGSKDCLSADVVSAHVQSVSAGNVTHCIKQALEGVLMSVLHQSAAGVCCMDTPRDWQKITAACVP